jgi:heat shock protein HtpX
MLTYTEISKNKSYSALLIFVFFVFIIGLGWIFSRAYNAPGLLILAVIFSSISALFSYYFSDSITLAISRAHQIDRKTNLELYRLVENLTIAAGLPMPKIYTIEDGAPNAFATGRDPNHAVIVYTTGILEKLNKTELEAVTAHELSHVGNYDIRFMTLVVVLVGIVTLLADWFLRISFFGAGRRSRDSNSGDGGQIFMIIGLVLAILSPIIATLIKLAVSRKREFLADASGVLLTRYPDALASALEKISRDQEPLEAANKATAHLYIVNPLKGKSGGVSWFANLFNTHPPIEERIKRLRGMNL